MENTVESFFILNSLILTLNIVIFSCIAHFYFKKRLKIFFLVLFYAKFSILLVKNWEKIDENLKKGEQWYKKKE